MAWGNIILQLSAFESVSHFATSCLNTSQETAQISRKAYSVFYAHFLCYIAFLIYLNQHQETQYGVCYWEVLTWVTWLGFELLQHPVFITLNSTCQNQQTLILKPMTCNFTWTWAFGMTSTWNDSKSSLSPKKCAVIERLLWVSLTAANHTAGHYESR